jgi:hypothetical protein
LLAPVVAGYIPYTALKDGSVSLWDLALMNEAVYIQNENQKRYMETKK